MTTYQLAKRAVFAAISLNLVGWSVPASAARPVWVGVRGPGAQAMAHTVYVSDLGKSTVWIFPAGVNDPSPIGQITAGLSEPEGVWIDGHGVLYVANFNGGTGVGSVTEYQPGATQPFRTITAGIFRPESVAVDSHGTLYVGQNANGTPQIVEYASGSATPLKAVFPTSLHGVSFMGGMAVDGAGNLYAAFFAYDNPPAHVVVFGPGLKNERDLRLQGLDNIDLNPGLARDGRGNLYVGGALAGINVYAPGSKTPARSISAGFSQYFTVSGAGALYVPNQHSVDEYAPGGSTPFAGITASLALPEGAALR
jgi:hypothetical protein